MTTMEEEVSELHRDDITFDTEETDDISQISEAVRQEEGVVITKNTITHKATKHSPQKQHQGKSNLVHENPRNDKKILWGVIVVLAILVGILAGLLLNNNSNEDEDEKSSTNTVPANPNIQPTQPPNIFVPTTLRGRVEYILKDYAPLDEPTLTWLLETSSWEPDSIRDPNYDYLWMERYAMALLYANTNGPNWANNYNWMSDEPVCRWFSLESNACPGPMTHLVLYLNKMEGTLPSVLFGLDKLQKLHVARNQFTGSSIPDSIQNMKNLTFLDLASTGLVGTIPSAFQNMTQLESLYLSGNELTGPIFEKVGAMKNLTVLSLWGNELKGTIPSSIGNMPRLKDLSLSENQLSGTIPSSIESLTSLSRLSLHTNLLSGTIPETIANMSNLQDLSLYENNQLEGSFPSLPETVQKCFLGSCFSDITNAVESRCIFFDNCD